MKLFIVSCLLLSLAGVSHQFIHKKFLKLGLLGGAKLGYKKSGDSEETCRSVPQQQCRNVEETVYESVSSKQCTKKPVQDCHQQQETTYEEVTRQECRDVTEQSCRDVQDKQCRTVSKPVQVFSFVSAKCNALSIAFAGQFCQWMFAKVRHYNLF